MTRGLFSPLLTYPGGSPDRSGGLIIFTYLYQSRFPVKRPLPVYMKYKLKLSMAGLALRLWPPIGGLALEEVEDRLTLGIEDADVLLCFSPTILLLLIELDEHRLGFPQFRNVTGIGLGLGLEFLHLFVELGNVASIFGNLNGVGLGLRLEFLHLFVELGNIASIFGNLNGVGLGLRLEFLHLFVELGNIASIFGTDSRQLIQHFGSPVGGTHGLGEGMILRFDCR